MTLPPGIQFNGVSFAYGHQEILKHISWHAPQSQTTVLFGPSGSGKTTCLRLISGLERCSQGEIHLDGKIVDSARQFVSPAQRSIGYCFQDDGLWSGLTARQHLVAVLKSQSLPGKEISSRVDTILQQFRLAELAPRYPHQLSGGEKKRLALARALVGQPKVLLLDEPLSSVEGPLREEMIETIWSIKDRVHTIVLVTHTLQEALALADTLVLINDHRVIQHGSVQEVFNQPHTPEVAQWLGYRNFFTSNHDESDGVLPIEPPESGMQLPTNTLAAALPEDTAIVANASGEWSVQQCYFQGSHYRLSLVYDKINWVTLSTIPYPIGCKVKLKWINPPKAIKQSSGSL